MRPLELKLEGFGSYAKETTINFDRDDLKLFLVAGDTGAGKSTIFEAIVFALYGSTNSEQVLKNTVVTTAGGAREKRKSASSLVSQYGTDDTTVTLTFAMGSGDAERVYKVTRQPARPPRPGKKNVRDPKATLELPDGSVIEQLEKVNHALRDIVKLDKNQFMQVGMLAQGQFMSLLTAKSKEKREIFGKLFGTGLYQSIEAEVQKEAAAAEEAIVNWWHQITGYASGILLPDEDAGAGTEGTSAAPGRGTLRSIISDIGGAKEPNIVLAEQLNAALEALVQREEEQDRKLRVQTAQAEQERNAADRLVHDAQQLQQLFSEAAKAKDALSALQTQKPEMDGLSVLAKKLGSAFRLRDFAQRAAKAERAHADVAARLKAAHAALPEMHETVEKAKAEAQTTSASYENTLKKHSQLSRKYNEALQQFEEIRKQERIIRKDSKSLEMGRSLLAQSETDLRTHREQTEAKRKELASLADIDVQAERRRADDASIKEGVSLRNTCTRAFSAANKAEETYRAARAQFEAADDALMKNRAQLFDDYAGVLAAKLEKGKPCPVCGSIEHPAPYKPSEDLSTVTMEAIEEAQEQVDALRKAAEKAQSVSAAARAKYETAEEHLRDKLKSIRAVAEDNHIALDGTEDSKTLLNIVGKAVRSALQELEKSKVRAEELQRELEGADERIEAFQKTIADTKADNASLETQIRNTRESIELLKKQIGFASPEEARRLYEESDAAFQQADSARKTADTALKNAQKSLTSTEASVRELEQQEPALLQEADEARKEYTDALAKEQVDEEEWKNLTEAHTPKDISVYEEKHRDFMASLHAKEGAAKAAAEKIEGRTPVDVAPLEEQAAAAAQRLQTVQSAYGRLAERLAQHRKTRDDLDSALRKHAEQAAAHARLKRLADRMNGRESQRKMKLETFVQRAYFEAVLDAANTRFRDMTGDQYELQLVDLDTAGLSRGEDGLELMIYSNATGQVREISTLSGGESFLAALSLALGMADVIEQQSSAVSLDMMFVDEGFGSLDDNARHEAVRILQQLTEGNKLIGIISHVSELKDEIDDQLVVTKDGSGSHAVWK